MIIDIHGHYTTEPSELEAWRDRQLAGLADPSRTLKEPKPDISDDQIRESIETGQLKQIIARGGNITLFSPRASGMAHHVGTPEISLAWTRVSTDLIHRVCTLYPENFIGVCRFGSERPFAR